MIQHHVVYSGTVQGVGFRYTVLNYARQLSLKGWVKNLPDGRVELMVEGDEDKIKSFVQNIDAHFEGYIKQKLDNFYPATGQFKDFQIVY